MKILWDAGPDVLACETIPSLPEAEAILESLHQLPGARAWFSFTCRNDRHTSHGEEFSECVRRLNHEPQVVAIGVNCTAPGRLASLIRIARSETNKPVVVYPNSGRKWDAVQRAWIGPQDERDLGALAKTWRQEGAGWIGGCCGTTPDDIRRIDDALRNSGSLQQLA
jgi:homocysteine S-methyltransferase